MADNWDDEDFDPDVGYQPPATAVSDRWEGEDEEEPTKASWEDEEDENKEGDENKAKAVQVKKKKKKIEDIIKEKEEKKRKEMEERRKQREEEMSQNTEEERLKRMQLQEESDLQLAKEAFGVLDDGRTTIDSMHPKTDEEFKEFGKLLQEKITKFAESEYYVDLLDGLFQACSIDLEPDQVKRLGTSLTAIGVEKAKAQKAAAAKGKKKTKKAVLAGSGKSSRNADMDAYDMGNDMDDFM